MRVDRLGTTGGFFLTHDDDDDYIHTNDTNSNSYNMPALRAALANAYSRLHNAILHPPPGACTTHLLTKESSRAEPSLSLSLSLSLTHTHTHPPPSAPLLGPPISLLSAAIRPDEVLSARPMPKRSIFMTRVFTPREPYPQLAAIVRTCRHACVYGCVPPSPGRRAYTFFCVPPLFAHERVCVSRSSAAPPSRVSVAAAARAHDAGAGAVGASVKSGWSARRPRARAAAAVGVGGRSGGGGRGAAGRTSSRQ